MKEGRRFWSNQEVARLDDIIRTGQLRKHHVFHFHNRSYASIHQQEIRRRKALGMPCTAKVGRPRLEE